MGRCWQTTPTCAGKRGARFVVIALAAYLLWSGLDLISTRLTSTPIRRSPSPESGGDDVTTGTVELSPWASQVHPGESDRAGRDRDPVARHANLETAAIPIELDFGRYRHAQEVTDSMSIETVATRASAAAAVALVRQRAPETRFLPIAARPVPDHPGFFQVNRVDRTGHALPGGWTFLADPTKPTVVHAATPTGSTSPRPCGAAPARNRLPNKGSEQST